MSNNNIALLFSIILAFYLINHVYTLRKEAIVGGIHGNIYDYGYTVSIQIRSLQDETPVVYSHICTGSLIHRRFVLSAAHCFVQTSGGLIMSRFSIVVGTNDLNDPIFPTIRVDIDVIYIPGYEMTFTTLNLAVAKLVRDLNIDNNSRLSILQLPPYNVNVGNIPVTVTGFGYDYINVEIDAAGITRIVNGTSTGFLRYAYVLLLHNEQCLYSLPGLFALSQICGIMFENFGVCTGDDGAPLVWNGIVLGILSKYNINDCNDSRAPSVYTKVSAFSVFINNLLEGNETFAIVYRNRNVIEIVNID